jgi:hypothetical protein
VPYQTTTTGRVRYFPPTSPHSCPNSIGLTPTPLATLAPTLGPTLCSPPLSCSYPTRPQPHTLVLTTGTAGGGLRIPETGQLAPIPAVAPILAVAPPASLPALSPAPPQQTPQQAPASAESAQQRLEPRSNNEPTSTRDTQQLAAEAARHAQAPPLVIGYSNLTQTLTITVTRTLAVLLPLPLTS